MREIAKYLGSVESRHRIDGWATGGFTFWGETWPNDGDTRQATAALRDAGWEAKFQIVSGREPAVLIWVRPLGGWPETVAAPVGHRTAVASIPSPAQARVAEEHRTAAAVAEADRYLVDLSTAIRAGLRFEGDGWAYCRNPALPETIQKGSAAWTHLEQALAAAGWMIDLWEGHPRDRDHTLKIRPKNG